MRESVTGVGLYLLSLAISAMAGALGGAVYVRHQIHPQRVLVLDVRRLAEPILKDEGLTEAARRQRIEQIGTAVGQTLGQYAQQGDIVLDASAVLRAPKDAYVAP